MRNTTDRSRLVLSDAAGWVFELREFRTDWWMPVAKERSPLYLPNGGDP